jgi:adenylate kinase
VRVAVTGTPGVGKTTATERLAARGDCEVVHLNGVVREEELTTGVDEARDSAIADLDAIEDWLADHEGSRDDRADVPLVVESHLAHRLPVDRAVVLRCHPETLERRLDERGEPLATVRENTESEALDSMLAEAVDRHGLGAVYEIDATDRDPDSVADAIGAVIAGEREPSAGTVSFLDHLDDR